MKTMSAIAVAGILAMSLAACGTGTVVSGVYPASAADCPEGTKYVTNPPWADESATDGRMAFRWCEE